MRLIDPHATVWHEPDGQGDSPAAYQIRPPTGADQLCMFDNAEEIGEGAFRWRGKDAVDIASKFLVGWRGIDDGEGKPVPFDASKIPCLPAAHLASIAKKILDMTKLGEAEKKG